MAVELFRESLSRDDEFALAYAGLGEAWWRRYEMTRETASAQEARSACERAVSLQPDLAVGHVCLGTVLLELGHDTDAAGHLLEAIGLDATSDDAYPGLRLAHARMGMPEAAQRDFQRAVELHPDYWASRASLGAFYYQQARYPAAVEQYQEAIRLNPNIARLYEGLGVAYAGTGRYGAATTALENALGMRPSFDGYTNLATYCLISRQVQRAVDALRQALTFEEANFETYGTLGKAYSMTPGQEDRARAALGTAIEMARAALAGDPTNSDIQILLAGYAAMMGDREDAVDALERALAARPGEPEYLFWAGVVHTHLGEPDAAFNWLRQARDRGYSVAEMRNSFELDDLKGDPRFGQLSR